MLRKLFSRRIWNLNQLVNGHFVEVKALYIMNFNEIPCVCFISELDSMKAFEYINKKYKFHNSAVYQHSYFHYDEQKMFFNNSIFVLTKKRMIELGDNYCQVLHTNHQYAWANSLIKDLAAFRLAVEPPKQTRIIGFARQTEMN